MKEITSLGLAEKLFKIHTHAELCNMSNPDQIVYKEADILALLQELGFPAPDFEGYGKIVGMELLSSPWDTVTESMNCLHMNYDTLGEHLGITGEAMEASITNKVPITIAIAEGLEKAFDIPKGFWLNREALYRSRLKELE